MSKPIEGAVEYAVDVVRSKHSYRWPTMGLNELVNEIVGAYLEDVAHHTFDGPRYGMAYEDIPDSIQYTGWVIDGDVQWMWMEKGQFTAGPPEVVYPSVACSHGEMKNLEPPLYGALRKLKASIDEVLNAK